MWLAYANVALPTYNVTEPRYPLAANMQAPKFKLYSSDVGILTYQCGMDVIRKLFADRTDINFGAIYENAVAQELTAHNHCLYYFKSRNIGELDFVIQSSAGKVMPIEVKSGKNYDRHIALNHVLNTPNYGIDEAIVLYDGNIKTDDSVTYLPIYMSMFL